MQNLCSIYKEPLDSTWNQCRKQKLYGLHEVFIEALYIILTLCRTFVISFSSLCRIFVLSIQRPRRAYRIYIEPIQELQGLCIFSTVCATRTLVLSIQDLCRIFVASLCHRVIQSIQSLQVPGISSVGMLSLYTDSVCMQSLCRIFVISSQNICRVEPLQYLYSYSPYRACRFYV